MASADFMMNPSTPAVALLDLPHEVVVVGGIDVGVQGHPEPGAGVVRPANGLQHLVVGTSSYAASRRLQPRGPTYTESAPAASAARTISIDPPGANSSIIFLFSFSRSIDGMIPARPCAPKSAPSAGFARTAFPGGLLC